ncbi:MAG: NifB/NifX family molybdenum-iron cluster-binding protein [Armatimonadota bacterium]|nr:NifB/NifX family molybdenum-iron cluster-binding protein [Armatimonadota bacterium]
MKIAVCSSGTTLDSPMDPRFGRCQYFVLVDTDTLDFSAEPNPGVQMGRGAGVAAAQVLSASGAEAVLAGNVGPNTFQALAAAGIPVYTCVAPTVREAVEQFKSGRLTQVSSATVGPHFGAGGAGFGPGMGRGGGRGMGRGRGRGGAGGFGSW